MHDAGKILLQNPHLRTCLSKPPSRSISQELHRLRIPVREIGRCRSASGAALALSLDRHKATATSNLNVEHYFDTLIMADRKQTWERAVAAGVVIATVMIAGTFSIPVHAAEIHAFALSPTPDTSSSDALMPGTLFIIAGLLIISLASFAQNPVKHFR